MLASAAEVCGEGEEVNWLCEEVLARTDNALLARLAGASSTTLRVIAIIVVAYLATVVLRRFVTRFAGRMERTIEERLTRAEERGAISDTKRFRTRRLQRLHAITGVLRGVVGVVVWSTAILVVLSELGVSLQPVLAGAGLAGIVIGFGAQQLVRDVLAGIAMLIEDQYGVGDWIEVDGKFGQVERVGLRSTAFRDVDGTLHHVLNGYIQRVGNLSQEWARATFDVPLALDADIPAAKALIHKVASDLAADPVWGQDIIGEPEIWGVQEFGPEGVRIRLVVPTKPLRNFDITRQLRERIKFAFEQAHIRMPSQLVELGGQRMGYTVLLREVGATDAEPREPGRGRARGLVPPGVGPLDRPPPATQTPGSEAPGGGAEIQSDAAVGAQDTDEHDTRPMRLGITPASETSATAPPRSETDAAPPTERADEPARPEAEPKQHRPRWDDTPDPRDLTTELRRIKGPRPRPD